MCKCPQDGSIEVFFGPFDCNLPFSPQDGRCVLGLVFPFESWWDVAVLVFGSGLAFAFSNDGTFSMCFCMSRSTHLLMQLLTLCLSLD